MGSKMTISRLLVAVIVIAALAGAVHWWRGRPAPSPPEMTAPIVRPARTITLSRAGDAPVRTFPGRVQSARGRRADVSFRVPGTIVELPVVTNQIVSQGQLLARLDSRDFETRLAQATSAAAEARARLAAMQAGDRPEDIRILESQLAAEQARLTEAERDYTSNKNLFDRGAATRIDLDRATRAVEVARAGVASATDALKRGQAGARAEDVEAQRALIARLEAQQREARDALADTQLLAPFPGVVARTLVETHQEVPARQPVVSLRDANGLEVVADMPESLMAQMGSANIRSLAAEFDFLPGQTFPLTFAEAESEADPRTRTFAVVFNLTPPAGEVRILPGMTATIRIETGATAAAMAPDQWSVPAGAVFVDGEGKRAVWKVDRDTQAVHRVAVDVGDVRGDQMVVRGALTAGDTIVTAGVNHLQEGTKVRPLPPEAAQIR